MNISEQDIESYMRQFGTSREETIKEITELLEEYFKDEEKAMQDVYADIKRSSY